MNITIAGTPIAVRRSGAGTPVVLLHCTGGSGNQWRGVVDALGRTGTPLRLLMPDLHGYGDSGPWAGHGPMTLADDAAIVEALARECGEPVHLVGHSYGGAVALIAALRAPELLRSLTLIEPAAFFVLRDGGPAERELFDEIVAVGQRVAHGVATGDRRSALRHFVDYWSGEGTWWALPAELRDSLCRRADAVAVNFWTTTSEPAGLSAVAGLAVPTLLVRGDATKRVAAAVLGRLAGTVRGAIGGVVPGAGHMLPATHAPQVAAAIAAHVACVHRRPAASALRAA